MDKNISTNAPAMAACHLRISPADDPATIRVQAAIDADDAPLHIHFTPGVHLCGGLRLRSDITLELEAGAELHFIPDYAAYAATRVSVIAEDSDRAMLVAENAQRITICGAGRIFCDGARAFSQGDDAAMGTLVPAAHRPRVLVFDRCRQVRVCDLRIDDSPMWTLHFVDCDDVHLTGLQIDNNRRMPNTDGVVIDGCRSVRIDHSTIRTADDGVVLKTSARAGGGMTGPCEDVVVTDCVIESQSCALKIGTESFAPFRRIRFENCRIEASNRGLGIFSRDGGLVEHVRFAGMTLDCRETPHGFWGSGEAVTINTLDRRPEDGPAGTIRDIEISGLRGTMEGAINLVAERPGDISGVTLRDIVLTQRPGPLGTGQSFDLRPTLQYRFSPVLAAGRINAWQLDAAGQVIGLQEYPGGMPGVFAKGIAGLDSTDVIIVRPDPLPQGWNPCGIVTV